MNRSVGAVIAGCAAAVMLHGCGGGGGGGSSSTCLNKQVDLVSQSVQGSTTGSLTATLDIKGLPPQIAKLLEAPIPVSVDGDFDLKFDLEQFNVRLDTTDNLELKAVIPIKATVDEKIIFDASKKELVLDSKITVDAVKPMNIANCSVLTINDIPPVENITEFFKTLKTAMQAETECKGNDGTYDDWRTKALPDPISKLVTASADFHMDKDYLWHEIDLNLQKVDVEGPIPLPPLPVVGNLTINSVKANGNTKVDVKASSKGGPSATDLDYTKLTDKCTKLPPMDFEDVVRFLSEHRMKARIMGLLMAVVANDVSETVVV